MGALLLLTMSSKKPKHKKAKSSFGQKIFGRFGKKKSEKHKKDKKDKKDANKRHSKNAQKSHKTIDVRPPKEIKLKQSYTISDVIHYQSQVIRSVKDDKRQLLVSEKLRLCSVCFDFSAILDEEEEE